MVDVFLIVAIVVAFLLLAVVGFYVLVKYQHPDDKNEAWFPKLVVWTGFVIAGATVLLLPLDVANNEGYPGCDGYDTQVCGGLNMTLFWTIFFWLIPAYVFVLIPFSTFYYEADDGMLMAGTSVGANAKKKSRIWDALKWEFATLVIVVLAFFLTYYFLSDTSIPIREYQYNGTTSELFVYETPGPRYNETNASQVLPFQSWELEPMGEGDRRVMESNHEFAEMGSVVVQVGLATFFAGLMAFIGWFFFALFGGVGIAAMPLDLIMNFVNRPRHMDAVEFAEAQMSIRERVNELVDIGELLKIEREQKEMANSGRGGGFLCFGGKGGGTSRKEAKEEKKTLRDFKKAVYMLERDVEDFQNCTANYNTYNPLIPIGSLILGICAFIISIFWILHIILYIIPSNFPPGNPITPFLNNYFQWFDRWFPLFGVLSVALFAFYLLLCAVKGCFKFGLRFLFFTIHPMKLNGTYMSSFLFNTGLILLCALPVVQFCTTAFASYAQYATVRQIFGTQIQYLAFFSYFWVNNVFVYAILAVALLTSVYLGCKPKDTSADGVSLRDRLKSRKG